MGGASGGGWGKDTEGVRGLYDWPEWARSSDYERSEVSEGQANENHLSRPAQRTGERAPKVTGVYIDGWDWSIDTIYSIENQVMKIK